MNLAHDVRGTGEPTVVLLHGIGGGRTIWTHLLDALADAGMRGVAVDLPGYGGSALMPPGGVHLMAAAVVNLLDSLDLRDAVIVGHSMGGMVAQEMAVASPRRVRGLVLACTSSAFGRPQGDWQAKFLRDRLAPLDAGQGMAGMARLLVPGMLSPGAVAGAREAAEAVMARVPEATYRQVLASLVTFDRRAELPSIGVPTLCLAAEHDGTAPPEVMRRMAERFPDAEFVELANAGHIANLEQPADFAATVIDFVQRRCAE